MVNRANEIETFKTANFIGEPLQYVSRGSNPKVPEMIECLNSFMMSENKHSKDMRLANWVFKVGVGYRLALRDKAETFMVDEQFDEAPFEVYVLDPRNTFVVRLNDVTQRIVMAVNYVFVSDSEVRYTVYTENETFTISGTAQTAGKIIGVPVTHNFGMIPIVEYAANPSRIGAFELVIDILDAINLTESNRVDGIEQFIQALMVFENADITREQFLELKDLGAIKLPSSDGKQSRVYYLNEQLDQTQTQTLVDAMYQEVLTICGMPSQGNANSSDSSNNGAVIMKNGWQNAEARAKETEGMWKESETEFLKIILKICNQTDAFNLKISEIEQKFCRRSYQDLLTQTQSFTMLIAANVPPILAFTISGIVVDPESAAIVYEAYGAAKKEQEQAEAKAAAELQAVNQPAPPENVAPTIEDTPK